MSPITLNVLLCAMAFVESGFDPTAVNKSEEAAGILQIRPIMVIECNRILGEKTFNMDDRYEVARSFAMAETFFLHAGRAYTRETGLQPSPQVLARCWNGGYDGWKEEATLPYWEKVNARVLEMMK